ncbi:MAG: fluoride efflux transporter CrcB [Euryarchaeota archaeon]|nr:fluoride efflux transporter CrcB [Euryarchaeota archaeon]|tara:strand:- start:19001 stop:19375 length:375 start_codon:yes stop_codon:yes gene_type:complete
MDTKLLALVAVGGAVGAVLRYAIQSMVEPDSEPYATLGVNLAGSLMLGALFGAIAAGTVLSEGSVVLIGTGFLGAFTTMSTFAMDSVKFSEESSGAAVSYVLLSVAGSLILAWIGYRAALSIAS